MKKQITKPDAEEYLLAAGSGHLSLLSIITANPKELMANALWIDTETVKTHTVFWGTTGEGMSTSPKKF